MPFRTKELLEEWVAEFEPETGGTIDIDVLRHDDGPGSDTGLIVVRLGRATTDVYLQPARAGEAGWEVHFNARDEHLVLDPAGVTELARELDKAVALCDFLARKSADHLASH